MATRVITYTDIVLNLSIGSGVIGFTHLESADEANPAHVSLNGFDRRNALATSARTASQPQVLTMSWERAFPIRVFVTAQRRTFFASHAFLLRLKLFLVNLHPQHDSRLLISAET